MKTITHINRKLRAALAISLISCTFLIQSASAQHAINLKKYIVPGSAMLVSGMLDGTIETISFHYEDGFKRVFTHANDQFWNPAVSWTNKYKNGNPAMGPKFYGSTGALVCFTDAYHGLRTCKNFINTATITFYLNRVRCSSEKISLRKMLVDALVLTAIRNIGFYATYAVLFKTTGNN